MPANRADEESGNRLIQCAIRDDARGKAGTPERAIAGLMTAAWMQNGCERPSYAPIVGSGINSTTLHYSANDRTMEDGEFCSLTPRANTPCTPPTSRARCR